MLIINIYFTTSEPYRGLLYHENLRRGSTWYVKAHQVIIQKEFAVLSRGDRAAHGTWKWTRPSLKLDYSGLGWSGRHIIGLSHVRGLIGIFINRWAAIIFWDDTVTTCTTYNYATSEEKLLTLRQIKNEGNWTNVLRNLARITERNCNSGTNKSHSLEDRKKKK